jgi:carbon-monoxide dehydrogenase small subunit
MTLRLTVNGKDLELECDPLRRLLDVLRDDLGLTETKEGCGEGECGACTVLMDGSPVCSCLVSALQADGKSILTAAGIVRMEEGRLIEECFGETAAVQCGFCFPGILVASYHYLMTDGAPSRPRIRRSLAGNICRCTGYRRIVDSLLLACTRRARGSS